jgi:Ca2+-binding EF-hand superfamily protein
MKYIARFVSVVAVAASAAATQAGNGLPPVGGMMPPPGGMLPPPPPPPPPPGAGGQNGGPMMGGPGGMMGGPGGMMGGPGGMMGGPGGGQQGGPGQGGAGGPMGAPHSGPAARQIAMLLAIAADADQSHDVTAQEWATFLASLNADSTTGAVDLTALGAALPPHPAPAGVDAATLLTRLFDKDQDGTVTLTDLNAFFALLDADGDGALSADELAPPHGGPGGDQNCQGGPNGLGGAADAWMAAMLLARAADADQSGDVTAEEWASFLASLSADENGVVDPAALAAALPAPPNHGQGNMARPLARLFDRNHDGSVSLDDLNAYFAILDKDGDGALSHDELAPPRPFRGADHRAARALFRAADADGDKTVTADEWTSFLDGLTVDDAGAVSLDDLASKLPAPPHGWPSDTSKRDAILLHAFDLDQDGVVTKADLQAVFDSYDKNADAQLKRGEMKRSRR